MKDDPAQKSLDFFDSAYENFLASVQQTQEIRKFYQLADFTLCLTFAGGALIDFLTPALQHLEIARSEKADLTICIWDGTSSQTPPIEIPWPSHSYALRGQVIGYNNERIYTVFDEQMQILQVFDKERHLALYWIKNRGAVPWWIGTSPLLFILNWWMRTRRYQLTHAAAVGYPEGGVLLAGKSGSGKSTTSLACMKAGMQYVSEDYCLLGDFPEMRVHSLYNSAKVAIQTLHLFPELQKQVETAERLEGDKFFFFHHKFQPEKILASCPLKALLTLKIEKTEESWLEAISPHEAIASLSVTTLWQLSHSGPAVFQHLKRVAEGLPCYRLHLGSDLAQVPQLIGKLL